jgi:putative DNA primase/helicase
MHVNRAPVAGSGKSYLADIAAAIATGRPCPVISAGADEEETEKRLGAMLISGQALISIDNLNGDLGGDFLCQLLERPIVQVRVLGRSSIVTTENRCTVLATGNNLTVVGDVVRRTLLASLDPQVERPELRQFKSKPVDMVLADRGRYIAAALTLVRAYSEAGCPGALHELASFEDWSRLVRSALVWLGCADPVSTMDTARAEDPELTATRRIYAAMHTDCPGFRSPGDIVKVAESTVPVRDAKGFSRVEPAFPELRDALDAVAGTRTGLSMVRLGRWLKGKKGRVVDGLRLIGTTDGDKKQNLWQIKSVI